MLADLPNPGSNNSAVASLNAVACPSASDCWAVGTLADTPGSTIVQHWNGIAWSAVAAPSPDALSGLNGVACVNAIDCWAVGQTTNTGLFLHWNGTAWSQVTAPSITSGNPTYMYEAITDVACPASNDCWATGGYQTQLDGIHPEWHTLAEHWNGAAWSIVTTPNDANGAGMSSYLSRLSCISGSDCWAVGSKVNAGQFTFAEHWNGTAWSIVATPNPPSPTPGVTLGTLLSGVSCTSTSNCWAVGEMGDYNADEYFTVIEHWDGSAWSLVAAPSTSAPDNYFTGVTCVSANLCWAVGGWENVTADRTLIARWDGSAWTIVDSPNRDVTATQVSNNFLFGVSCASAVSCWAVGNFSTLDYDTTPNQPLGLRYVTPDVAPIANAGLNFARDEGTTANLHGIGTDADPGDTLSYQWQQRVSSGNPVVALSNAGQPDASFTAPEVDADTILVFRLTVTDSQGASGSDDVAVTVRNLVAQTPKAPKLSNNVLGSVGALPVSTLGFILLGLLGRIGRAAKRRR